MIDLSWFLSFWMKPILISSLKMRTFVKNYTVIPNQVNYVMPTQYFKHNSKSTTSVNSLCNVLFLLKYGMYALHYFMTLFTKIQHKMYYKLNCKAPWVKTELPYFKLKYWQFYIDSSATWQLKYVLLNITALSNFDSCLLWTFFFSVKFFSY